MKDTSLKLINLSFVSSVMAKFAMIAPIMMAAKDAVNGFVKLGYSMNMNRIATKQIDASMRVSIFFF